jgi:mitogen-activated protein kinase 1/3
MQGYLLKRFHPSWGRKWKKRYLVLFPGHLDIYKQASAAKNEETFVLSNKSTVRKVDEKEHCFEISSEQNGPFIFCASSDRECREWMSAINDCTDKSSKQRAAARGEICSINLKVGTLPRPTHTFVAHGVRFEVDTRYSLVKPIGHGAYGVVVSALDSVSGSKVAIKKVSKAFEDLIDAKRVVRETKVLQHFNHENILSALDIIRPSQPSEMQDVYIVTELMETDLHRVIYSHQPLSDDHVQVVALSPFTITGLICPLSVSEVFCVPDLASDQVYPLSKGSVWMCHSIHWTAIAHTLF